MSDVLIHIGFPKSGSTYLQEWFERHPDIYYQPKFIAKGFYDAWELARFAEQTEVLPQQFVLSCEDFTIWHVKQDFYGLRKTYPFNYRRFQNNLCETLHKLFPQGKVLIVARGYKTIFRSVYSQYLAMAGSLTPAEFAKENAELLQTMLDYDYVINLYRKKFGNENVILLPYELLREKPEEFLKVLSGRMNLNSDFHFKTSRVNASYNSKVLAAYLFCARIMYKLLLPFPASLQQKFYRSYSMAIRKKKPHPLMLSLSKILNTELNVADLDAMLENMEAKASALGQEELFKPYLNDYLL